VTTAPLNVEAGDVVARRQAGAIGVGSPGKGDVGGGLQRALALALEDLGRLNAQEFDGLLEDLVLGREDRHVVHGHDRAPLFGNRRNLGDGHGGVARNHTLRERVLWEV
jgi:hypothetical protein